MTSCPCSLAPRDHPDLVSPPSSLRISLASSPLKASPESTKYWMSQQFKLMSPGSVAVCRPTQNHKPFHTQVWLRAWWVCSCAEPGHRGHEGGSEARKSRTLYFHLIIWSILSHGRLSPYVEITCCPRLNGSFETHIRLSGRFSKACS